MSESPESEQGNGSSRASQECGAAQAAATLRCHHIIAPFHPAYLVHRFAPGKKKRRSREEPPPIYDKV